MNFPPEAYFKHYGIWGGAPTMWYGVTAVDGDAKPWNMAPVNSVYAQLDATNDLGGQCWVKVKNDGNDNDWSPVGGTNILAETVAYTDFTDGGSTAGTYAMKTQIPQGAFVERVIVQDITGFAGDTSATLTVGDGTDVDRYNTGTPSVFSTANMVAMGAPSGTQEHTAAATVTLTVTSATDFTSVSAGQFTIKIFYRK